MRTYINRAEKEMIVCLAASKGFIDVTAQTQNRLLNGCMKELRTANTMLGKVIDHICEQVEQNQMEGIMRFANESELMVYPKSSPINQKEYFKVERKDLEELLQDSISDCLLCMNDSNDIKKCRKRKLLLKCGIIPNGKGECPFMR